jgi:hypothetical protein
VARPEDQHPVGEFGADGQDEANGFGCVLIRRPTARNWYRALALPAGLAEFTLLPVLVGATPPAAVADPVRTLRNVRQVHLFGADLVEPPHEIQSCARVVVGLGHLRGRIRRGRPRAHACMVKTCWQPGCAGTAATGCRCACGAGWPCVLHRSRRPEMCGSCFGEDGLVTRDARSTESRASLPGQRS